VVSAKTSQATRHGRVSVDSYYGTAKGKHAHMADAREFSVVAGQSQVSASPRVVWIQERRFSGIAGVESATVRATIELPAAPALVSKTGLHDGLSETKKKSWFDTEG